MSDLDDFVTMSAALTGFDKSFLQPELDPLNLSQAYFDETNRRAAATLQTLLTEYRNVASQPAQQIANTLLETTSTTPLSANAQLAQSIVLLWYTGAWYAPGQTGKGPVQIVSSDAYTHGLVWNAMQSHPMGYSEWVFGYWSKPPNPLSDFGVGGGGQ